MKAILAGLMIGIGGMVYLSVGGPIGAALFATGLLTILLFKFELFTGKAGLLAARGIGPVKLAAIWGGNWIGCFIAAALCSLTEPGYKIAEAAAAIIQVRISNEWYQNIALGIFCGLLMFIAVNYYKTLPWVTVMCVATFILIGVNHCVADMFYFWMALGHVTDWKALDAIICTTIGNVIGCNIIPYFTRTA